MGEMTMALLGNIIWFITTGWWLGSLYLISALVLFPLLPFLLPLIRYSFFPFGRRPVANAKIKKYKSLNNSDIEVVDITSLAPAIRFLANVVWIVLPGWQLAIGHFIAGIINLILCVFLITIPICLPIALANFLLIPVAFQPFGSTLLPNTLADDIEFQVAKSNL